MMLFEGCKEVTHLDRPSYHDRIELEKQDGSNYFKGTMLPLASWNIEDPRVLDAIRSVRREEFVSGNQAEYAQEDRPLPIGRGQTISQPYIVAYMSAVLQLQPGMRVLEVGTGSGYQAAVLAEMGAEVYTVERIAELAESAQKRLARLGYRKVRVRHGDGSFGWPEEAPFERIIITAALRKDPEELLRQLSLRGRMIYPLGGRSAQQLKLVERDAVGAYRSSGLLAVMFVPFVKGTA